LNGWCPKSLASGVSANALGRDEPNFDQCSATHEGPVIQPKLNSQTFLSWVSIGPFLIRRVGEEAKKALLKHR
jgi:hypothetical protein